MRIIDAMNYVRRVFEKDVSGRAARTILNEQLREADVTIWVWDGPGAKASRQQVYPKYKAKRLPPPEDIWPIISLIKDALTHTKALQIGVPRFEADDLIATLVRRHPSEPKFIVSNDADLRQLLTTPNTQIEAKAPAYEVKPEYIRLFKTCVGDASDNISGIPGFGRKTWEKVNHKELQKQIREVLQGRVGDFNDLDIPTRSINWIRENPLELQSIWAIVGLWDVPDELIQKNTIVGVQDHVRISEILSQFYL